jgi:hypothetical protein
VGVLVETGGRSFRQVTKAKPVVVKFTAPAPQIRQQATDPAPPADGNIVRPFPAADNTRLEGSRLVLAPGVVLEPRRSRLGDCRSPIGRWFGRPPD